MAQFTIKPNYTVQLDEVPRLLEAKMGDGYSQRVPDGLNTMPMKFSLRWNKVTYARLIIIRAFFIALWQSGSTSTSFTWIPPRPVGDGVTQLRWTCPQGLSTTFIEEDNFSVTAIFEQAFE